MKIQKVDGRVLRAQKQREVRRTAVLSVARRLFSQRGFHATSIDDLIEGADIARGTFYLYFESKRAIFDELLDGLFTTLQATVRQIDIGPGAPPPVAQIESQVTRILDTLLENREIARILLHEAVGIDADFDHKLAQFYGRIEALIAHALENGQKMGLIRRCESAVVARCLLGSLKEVVHWAFVDREPEAVDVQRFGRELIAFALKGVLIPS